MTYTVNAVYEGDVFHTNTENTEDRAITRAIMHESTFRCIGVAVTERDGDVDIIIRSWKRPEQAKKLNPNTSSFEDRYTKLLDLYRKRWPALWASCPENFENMANFYADRARFRAEYEALTK